MKQVIYVTTKEEAIRMAFNLTNDYTMYNSSIKKAYIKNIKYVAEQGLRGLYNETYM